MLELQEASIFLQCVIIVMQIIYPKEMSSSNTAQPRVKLYKLLETAGNKVLYYDTGSCVFVAKDGEDVPQTR